jgi:hypothetical protein
LEVLVTMSMVCVGPRFLIMARPVSARVHTIFT